MLVLVLLFVLLQQNPLRLLLAMALYMLLSPLGQLQALLLLLLLTLLLLDQLPWRRFILPTNLAILAWRRFSRFSSPSPLWSSP